MEASNYRSNIQIQRAFENKSSSKTGRLEEGARQCLINMFMKETNFNIKNQIKELKRNRLRDSVNNVSFYKNQQWTVYALLLI